MNGLLFLSKLKLVTVEPVLFLYMMLIFMESNALQELIFVKCCIKVYQPVNISSCSYELKNNLTEAMDEASVWSKYNNMCLFLFTLLTSFYVGSWSDSLGRKFPMLVPPLGTAIAAGINLFLSVYIETHVSFFFISSFISGITFGSVGIIASTYGYISDFTHEQSRTKRIVILESMVFIGGTVGIYIAGAFLKNVDYDLVLNNFAQLFIFEAVLATCIIIYVIFRIPRYTSDTQSLHLLSFCGLVSLRHIVDSFKTVFKFREDGKRRKIILMLIALFLIYFGAVVQFTLAYYFVKNLRGWSFNKYSNFHAVQFATEGAALLFGLPLLFHILHVPDHFVGMLGMASRITGFIVFGLSINDAMVYSCAALYMFSEFPVPVLRSMLSKTVGTDEKGKIFAFTTVLQNLCFLLGSFVLMTIFTEFSFKGLAFEVVAALQGIALIIFIYLYLTRKAIITVYETIENEDGSSSEICSVVAASDPAD